MLQRGTLIISRRGGRALRNNASIRRNALALMRQHELNYATRSISSSPSTLASWINGNNMLGNNNDRYGRNSRNHRFYDSALPRIELFSSTSATSNSSSSKDDDRSSSDASTFRERFNERSEQGKAAARQGAKSAGDLAKRYGPVFVGTYLGVYVTTLGSLYAGIQSGLLDPASLLGLLVDTVDPDTGVAKSTADMTAELLQHYSWTKSYAPMIEEKPYVANFAIAWISTKFTEPPRLAVTAAIVPRLARYFGFVDKDPAVDDNVVTSSVDNKDEMKSEDEKTDSSSTTANASDTSQKQ